MGWWSFSYKPYVSVAQRQAKAKREVQKLAKNGRVVTPVAIVGSKITTTFWGKAWSDNLESYSDYSNRLPRGRSYVKNGSVCDLQIEAGKVTALVCGSELYEITIKIEPLPASTWEAIKVECAGQIGSLIELLQGKLSKAVMEVVTRRDGGLFPKPREIKLDCSCPDWADMCKHVAAALYGVGARLDLQPDLLFKLRQVDHLELITGAGAATAAVGKRGGRDGRRIASGDLADVFGVEMESAAEPAAPPPPAPASLPAKRRPPARSQKLAARAPTRAKPKPRTKLAMPGRDEKPRKKPAKAVRNTKPKRRATA